MFANDQSSIIHCGFGGCKAPERPLPVSLPGLGSEGEEQTRDSRPGEHTGVVIYVGFGGCRAPKKPMPMVLPGAFFRKGELLAA